MSDQEFKKKYGFEKPEDSRERDMIIMSTLSNMQLFASSASTKEIVSDINSLKQFILDTKNLES